MPAPLSPEEVATALEGLHGWTLEEEGLGIRKRFEFLDFGQAWGFMSRSALVAERLGHHPEWFNVWSLVDVRLSTHDAGGLTALDMQLAEAMDAIAHS